MNATTTQNQVTNEMLEKAHRYVDEKTNQVFYIVESRTTDGVEYRVQFNKEHHCMTCTCPSMNPETDAYGMPLWAPRTCWHVRSAIADSKLYREEQAIKRDYEAQQERIGRLMLLGLTINEAALAVIEAPKWRVDGQAIDDETLARVYGSHRYPSAVEADRQAEDSLKPFSLLK